MHRSEFSAEAFRDRARERLTALAGEAFGDFRNNPADPAGSKPVNPRAAAVLIPIVARRPEATVLLTLRTDHLPSHAGQIAFPGGKIYPDDDGPEGAALREAAEEVGLGAQDIEIVVRAPDYLAATGYLISPVLGMLSPDHRLTINRNEVADAFEVPLSFLMDPQNHAVGSIEWGGTLRYFYEIPFQERRIWGITAGIIRMIYETLYEDRS